MNDECKTGGVFNKLIIVGIIVSVIVAIGVIASKDGNDEVYQYIEKGIDGICTTVYETKFGDTLVLSSEPLTHYNGVEADRNSKNIDERLSGSYNSPIKKVVILDEMMPRRTAGWFAGFNNLETIEGIEKIDVAFVEDMSQMFYNCRSLKKIEGLSEWNVGNVTNMHEMFGWCMVLENIDDLSKWNVNNVKDMGNMFECCGCLQKIGDLSEWNVSNVKNFGYMFLGCNILKNIGNLDNWEISDESDMIKMFSYCDELIKIPSWYQE